MKDTYKRMLLGGLILTTTLVPSIGSTFSPNEVEAVTLSNYESHIPDPTIDNFVSTRTEMALIQRNLNQTQVMDCYLNVNMLSTTHYTVEELNRYLRRGLKGLGHIYKKAEEETGVNALLLIAISALESGHGTSPLARDFNNLFGFGAFDGDVRGNAWRFSSYEESILVVAERLRDDYLLPTGKFYNGSTIVGMNVKYCTDKEWKHQVNTVLRSIDTTIENRR